MKANTINTTNKIKQRKKGISLVVLAVTIIVMVILTGVIIISSTTTVTNVNKSKLQMDIAQIESLMDTYRIRKNGVIDFETVAFDTSTLTSTELEQFEGETITDNKIELYVIDLLAIDAEGVNFGNLEYGTNDRYLYSAVTKKVYYEHGLTIDDVTYYYVENGEG